MIQIRNGQSLREIDPYEEGNHPASANVLDLDVEGVEEFPEALSIDAVLASSSSCNEDIPPYPPLAINDEHAHHRYSMSSSFEAFLRIARVDPSHDYYSHFDSLWGPRDLFCGYRLRLMNNVHHLDLLAATYGIDILDRAHTLLSQEPALPPLLISIIERIVPTLQRWDGSGSITIDSFTDPDTDLPETIRFIFHPSDDKQWDETMEKWDDISTEVSALIPLRNMRRRFIISFEPEF